MCDRGGGTKWRRGWKAVQNVSFNLFPLLIADSIFSFFCFCFNPSVLRTPPLYFAVHNTGEEDCNAVFFPILFCSAPQCYGTRQGKGCDLILLLLLSQFFNPSVLRTPPLYFAVHNTGEEDCNAVFFPILFCSAPQCCGTRQGERLRFDFVAVTVAVF